MGISVYSGSYDYTESTNHELSGIYNNYQILTSDIGTKKWSGYNFYGRFNIPLGENILFGLGGYLNRSTTNRETDYIESEYYVTDNTYNYVTTETSQLKADRNYNVSTIALTSPVGLEYKIGKKRVWSLRFGSTFTLMVETINDAKQITDSEPEVTEKEYYDGEVTIDIEDNIYESTHEKLLTISSSTIFTYGIGCNPMENLQIDVLGFLDSESIILDPGFYLDLRLSFTMKF